MTEPDRGESYLEVQMDRTTIVLAALGFVACLVVTFLLGSWTASRKIAHDAASAGAATAPPADADLGASGSDEPTSGGHDEDVAADSGFGGKPISAAGAPPLTAVPPPRRVVIEPVADRHRADPMDEPVDVPPVAAHPPAPRPQKTIAKPAPEPPKTIMKPEPKPRATTPAPAATPASPASSDAWVVQVAAMEKRADADALSRKLKGRGHAVRIVEEKGMFKVQVGPFASRQDAQGAKQKLEKEGSDRPWIKPA